MATVDSIPTETFDGDPGTFPANFVDNDNFDLTGGGELRANSSGGGVDVLIHDDDLSSNDVSATLSSYGLGMNSRRCGPFVGDASGNGYAATNSAAAAVRVVRFDSYVATEIANITGLESSAAPNLIQIQVVGSTITVFRNGVQAGEPIVDATHSTRNRVGAAITSTWADQAAGDDFSAAIVAAAAAGVDRGRVAESRRRLAPVLQGREV